MEPFVCTVEGACPRCDCWHVKGDLVDNAVDSVAQALYSEGGELHPMAWEDLPKDTFGRSLKALFIARARQLLRKTNLVTVSPELLREIRDSLFRLDLMMSDEEKSRLQELDAKLRKSVLTDWEKR